LVKIESVVKAIRERIPTRTEPNAQAAIEAFEQLHV